MDSSEVLAQHFFEHLKKDTQLRPATIMRYKTAMRRFLSFVRKRNASLSTLSLKDLQIFLNEIHEQKISSVAASDCSTALRRFYAFAHAHFGVRDIAYDIRPPKVTTQKVTPEIIRSILRRAADPQETAPRDVIIIYLFYACKVPVSTIVKIMQEHVEATVERGAIFDPDRKLTVLLPGLWADKLRAFARIRDKSEKWFFYGSANGQTFALTHQAAYALVKEALRKALEPNQHRTRSIEFLKQNSTENTMGAHLDSLKKLYEKNHPRA